MKMINNLSEETVLYLEDELTGIDEFSHPSAMDARLELIARVEGIVVGLEDIGPALSPATDATLVRQ